MELLTSFGPAGAVVAVVLLFLNFMTKEGAANRQSSAIETNKKEKMYAQLTEATNRTADAVAENSDLIRNLNGKLTAAVIDKARENRERKLR